MGALIALGIIVAAWILVDVLALSRGVDSRPMSSDPHKPSGILTV